MSANDPKQKCLDSTFASSVTVFHAALASSMGKAYLWTTGTPTKAMTVKIVVPDFVHGPFSEHLSTPSTNHARGLRLSSLRKNSPVL
jgi:hypothetical protein